MFPGSIGYQELVLIGVVAVILFGSRLPEVAKTLGQSYQQFRKGISDLQSTINSDTFDSGHNSKTPAGLPDYSDSDSDFEENSGPMFNPPTDND